MRARGPSARGVLDQLPRQVGRPVADRRTTIVVGVDDSHWGRMALRWATWHAALAGAPLEVHLAPAVAQGAPPAGDPTGILDRTDALAGTGETDALPPVTSSVVVGSDDDAVSALVGASRHAGLVVLGCRGTGHQGIGLGATVLPVVSAAACDVVVVGGHADAVRGGHHRVSVQVGTDSDASALRSATRLAHLRGVRLHIALPVPVIGDHPMTVPVQRRIAALHWAEELVHDVDPTVPVTTELRWTSPHEAATTDCDTDLLVVGIDGDLGPTARSALYHAPNPVLVARATSTAHEMTSGPHDMVPTRTIATRVQT
jgi:nucleotide-binding universal stress UspA family protein